MTAGIAAIGVGSLLLFDTVVSYGPLYRGEAVAVGLSTIPPLAALLVWAYGLGPVPELNLTTTLFLPHVALDAYAFVGSGMFEFHPATRRVGERAAIDDLGTPVVIVDERGRVVTLNAAAEDAFDVEKSVALTRPLDALLDEGTVALAGARTPGGGDTVTVRREGGQSVYAVTSTPLVDGRDRHVGHTVVFQDVTAERRREQRLNVLNRVLRHNLRNEMTVIRGFTEMAADGVENDDAAAMLDRALGAADDLSSLGEKAREVERVLDRDGRAEQAALAPLLERVREDRHEANPEATVTVNAGDVSVTTDPPTLETVVGELLENALVHGGAAPTVTLGAERREEGVAVTVTDDGPGVPEHERAAIDAGAESPLEHGSGLGLWVVRWVCESCGGRLHFGESDLGGTAVVLSLTGADV